MRAMTIDDYDDTTTVDKEFFVFQSIRSKKTKTIVEGNFSKT
jgi:hypothetical protein